MIGNSVATSSKMCDMMMIDTEMIDTACAINPDEDARMSELREFNIPQEILDRYYGPQNLLILSMNKTEQ